MIHIKKFLIDKHLLFSNLIVILHCRMRHGGKLCKDMKNPQTMKTHAQTNSIDTKSRIIFKQ